MLRWKFPSLKKCYNFTELVYFRILNMDLNFNILKQTFSSHSQLNGFE